MSAISLKPKNNNISHEDKNSKEKKYKINANNILNSFIIGTLSNTCAEMAYYPIEKRYKPHLYNAPKNNPLHLKKYIHMNGVLKDLFNDTVYISPVTGFVFACYGIMEGSILNRFPNINPVELAYTAGSLGIFFGNIIYVPYYKIHGYRLINNQKQMNYFKSAASFVKNEGFFKLWKGFWNGYFSIAPFLTTFFALDGIYQKAIVEYNKRNHPEKPIPIYLPAIGSTAAATTSIFLTTPLEYLRISVLTKKKLDAEKGKELVKQIKIDSEYKAPRFGVRKISTPVLGRGIANTRILAKQIQQNIKSPSIKTILQKVIFRK